MLGLATSLGEVTPWGRIRRIRNCMCKLTRHQGGLLGTGGPYPTPSGCRFGCPVASLLPARTRLPYF